MIIDTTKISASIWTKPMPLIARLSFEERSAVVSEAATPGMCRRGILFVSEGRSDLAQRRVEAVTRRHPALAVVELRTGDPLGTAMSIRDALNSISLVDAIIDVTAFRREELLMLLQVLRGIDSSKRRNCRLVYVAAGKMADPLSGKVIQCRSVVGYAGEIWPRRPTTLVVLMGFEIPRARAIIEAYEPRYLVLGRGRKSESISDELSEKNDAFFQELASNYANIEHTFEFSARNPLLVADELEAAIPSEVRSNVVVAPLNTKLSTIGVGLFAQRKTDVQVCYAEVGAYNEETYSTVGTKTYILSLTELFSQRR
ncbi:hypothetical protein [Rhizobium leguminosarum]|uniref:hypothetical protein n=1 Tax=Rhizobium leguminosarum TaxID=384 RepID=UPI0010322211|nr:hypothetical protein [Rhizobium leguminosarum]TAY99666.1 hypothetical protein ELH79_14775 [Rhizobium leguminosarum]TAZ10536.1 hypothetical protein ELH78_15660 [Rhizobium leguminosarum]